MKNRIVCLLAILACAGVASTSAQAPSDAPVEARIPFAPIPAKSNGQTIVAYELHVTNLIARELTLNRIEVFRHDIRSTPIVSYQNANLINLIVQPGNPSTTNDKRKIAGGTRAIVYMWLTFDKQEAVGGNHVIISLRNGHYAYYAHLQPGSIRVKPGDHVRRGQVLGLLGNSGNSDAPHLHFHISNGDSPMGSEGVPFLFDSFEVLGSAEMEKVLTQGWTVPAAVKPDKRLRDMPVENQVITFE